MGTWGSSTHGSRRRVTSHPLVGLAIATTLVVAGCSNRSESDTTTPPPTATPTTASSSPATDGTDESTPDSAPDTTPVATDPPGVTFGDLPSPCGPGNATIADGQNGGDTLKLATATDKGAEVAPGLNAEMYDAAVAFTKWCNEQGGIAGLKIDLIDADAKLFEVPATMERICSNAFAMVGGGLAFDDQEFPRFHECGMIDIAGYAVTTTKAGSNGLAMPVPNAPYVKNGFWLQWAAETHPDDVAHMATVYADAGTTQIVEQQYVEMMGDIPGYEVVDRVPYSPLGEANWAPIAQRLKESGVKAMTYVGVPETLAQLLTSMKEIGFEPNLIIVEGGFYANVLIDRAGAAAEGVVTRIAFTPFEEASESKAVADYLAMMDAYNPDGKIASLGLQATSAYLLFATAANTCLAQNDGVLERECVLAAALATPDWTGGGMHAPTSPGDRKASPCSMLMTVQDGAFTRLFPERGSADDDGNGFNCRDDAFFELKGDYGDPEAGVDPDREN